MMLVVLAVAVLALVIAAIVVALVVALDRGGTASPPYDQDRYEATERFRNNLPPSI